LGITSIVVSHDVQELSTIAHDSLSPVERRVAAAGSPQQLRKSDSPAVRQFITGSPDGPVPFHYPAPTTHPTPGCARAMSNGKYNGYLREGVRRMGPWRSSFPHAHPVRSGHGATRLIVHQIYTPALAR